MPLHTTLRQILPRLSPIEINNIADRLRGLLAAIEGVHITEHNEDLHECPSFRIEAKENTWSRSARRKRKRTKLDSGESIAMEGTDNAERQDAQQVLPPPKLFCDIHVIPDGSTGSKIGEVKGCDAQHPQLQDYSLECQWIFGADHGLFESLAGHIGRKLIESIHT